MRKIGLLGGTFDPPHFGHLLIAEQALEACQLDEVWFMPTKIPPHKKGSNLCSDEDRIEMVKKAINDHPFFKLSLIEFERNGPSYTIETMKELTAMYKENDFYFIIGGDMIEYLPKWKEIDELLNLVTFVGVKRPGFISTSIYSDNLVLINVPQLEISSRDIRERLKQGRSIRYLLPDHVLAYIKERQLYG
ncbi:nicotinic acid mononucleotide adenylyltransferase [Anaerobacillus arseniciselenatis]|uniref:Probable nicotinate-nucleotide adenylyltransferase n=1 Tax=Anaerobacillus arseniciselenatis TaxID=85682 RepID=A0A1S2LVF5_9BACI|nr:nicotinate-nucleotide adenylyltransferase [Anaerobacillus arseniciselenatis]OIJ16180.1 nicotinic acid mononucleotide adenylyltransferase [Anaerobacillus arseniciselenatis]